MCITLQNYQPFSAAHALANIWVDAEQAPALDCLQLAKKVGIVALTVIALLPTLLLEMALYPFVLAVRHYYPAQLGNVSVGKIPEQDLINRLAANPYTRPDTFPSHIEFFQDSLKQAFLFLGEAKTRQYKELIESGGAVDEGQPSVEIFQWSASCLIAHYLRTKDHDLYMPEDLFPKTTPSPEQPLLGHPEEERKERNLQNEREIDLLWNLYFRLNREEKAAALLQLIVPEQKWQLTESANRFLQAAQRKAQAITQNQEFNRQIYRPATEDIGNI